MLINTIIRLIIPTLIGVYAIEKGIQGKDGQFLMLIVVIIAGLYISLI